MKPGAPSDLPAGARAGVILGSTSWALALAVACLVTGEFALLWRVALPGFVVSLVLAAAAIAALHRRHRRHGPMSPAAQFELLAALCLLAAILLTLAGAWVLPALLASPAMRDVLDATRSATWLPWPIPAVLAAAGLVFLWLARRRATSP